MSRGHASSPRAPGTELRRRYLAGGGLAALGMLLMVAAFHPDTSTMVMQWVGRTTSTTTAAFFKLRVQNSEVQYYCSPYTPWSQALHPLSRFGTSR